MSSGSRLSFTVMQGIQRTLVCSLLFLLSFLLSGCNLVGGKTTTLSLDTTPTSIAAGSQTVFTASISHNNGNFLGANWTLASSGVACPTACGTLSNPANNGSQGNGDTATITYTAPATPPTPNSITITATSVENPSSSGADTFTITPPTPTQLVVQTVVLPPGSVGVTYPSTTLQATGGVSPYTWVVDSGTLPAGLSLSSAGVISGTPTAPANTFNFDVTVQDSSQVTASSPETITVANAGGNACDSTGGNESLLKGQYAFLLQGLDSSNQPDVAAGTFTADGAGNITGGEEDLNLYAAGAESKQGISAASNAYILGSDNRGCLTLATSTGTVVFHFTVGAISSGVAAKGTLVEWNGTYTAGVMKLQDSSAFSTAAINGHYAFGFDSPLPGYFATVGSFSASAGTVSSGTLDVNISGNVDFTGASGTPSNPVAFTGSDTVDSKGRGTFSFTSAVNQANSVCYVVSAVELYCISSDSQSVNPAFAGKILQQSGAPFSNTSISGNLIRYQDGIASTGVGVKAEIALVQADGAGNFSQAAVANDGGTYDNGLSASGTYAVAGNGRLTIPGNGPAPLFYLVVPNEAFTMSTDPIVSFGFMEGQTGTSFTDASLTGNYFFGQVVPSGSGGQFQTGEEALDGAGNLSGTADASQPGGLLFPTQSLAGGSYSISTTGFGTIMRSGTLNNVFYVISPTKWVMIDTVGTGPELQVVEQ